MNRNEIGTGDAAACHQRVATASLVDVVEARAAMRVNRRPDPALELQDDPRELMPRRRPTQERSKRKFDALLHSSRELLVEVGFESFTCEEVAARAEVPIGTLYQFFANKYVIVCELNRQDLVAVTRELSDFHGEVPSMDWLRHMNKFVDHMADLWMTDPSRREVWLAMQSTPSTRATGTIHEKEFAEVVQQMLRPLMPRTPRVRRSMMARGARARGVFHAQFLGRRTACGTRTPSANSSA